MRLLSLSHSQQRQNQTISKGLGPNRRAMLPNKAGPPKQRVDNVLGMPNVTRVKKALDSHKRNALDKLPSAFTSLNTAMNLRLNVKSKRKTVGRLVGINPFDLNPCSFFTFNGTFEFLHRVNRFAVQLRDDESLLYACS